MKRKPATIRTEIVVFVSRVPQADNRIGCSGPFRLLVLLVDSWQVQKRHNFLFLIGVFLYLAHNHQNYPVHLARRYPECLILTSWPLFPTQTIQIHFFSLFKRVVGQHFHAFTPHSFHRITVSDDDDRYPPESGSHYSYSPHEVKGTILSFLAHFLNVSQLQCHYFIIVIIWF